MLYAPSTPKKILIANRSEIALRIQQTCKALGIATVAVYAPEDAHASYVYEASESYALSLHGFQAYLNQEELLSIAKAAQVDAIHPGYGFLSESASFAEKVKEAGIIWIGPDVATMILTGDKAQARSLMRMIGVPTSHGREFKPVAFDLHSAKECAQTLGYPVIIKDSLGGGGKAMRRVDRESDFDNAWHAVLSEGKRLGFSGDIIVEKYLSHARHIEVQIAGDGERFIHLYERDCSIQRKHQKIIEEAPCSFLVQEILNKMYVAALSIARSVRYKGVGTVEFLVTASGEFYFLEVNARLQVEHSVTELITGIDLVALQLAIAFNGILPLEQKEVKRRGHALECRIYAEDPFNNFIPCSGKISFLGVPRGPFVRVDHDLYTGCEITPFFDAMIAKVSVSGFDRASAIANMQGALADLWIVGCTTNRVFLQAVLADHEFGLGFTSTNWLNDQAVRVRLARLQHLAPRSSEDNQAIVVAAILQQALEEKAPSEVLSTKRTPPVSRWRLSQWK